MKLTSVDQLTYSEFVFSLENPTCFNLLRAEPLEGFRNSAEKMFVLLVNHVVQWGSLANAAPPAARQTLVTPSPAVNPACDGGIWRLSAGSGAEHVCK